MNPTELFRPDSGEWIDVCEGELPVDATWKWANLPHCGGVVTFCGTVRDYSDGRPAVSALEYEAYLDQVVPRLADVATAARSRWPEIGRVALLHRVGRLEVGEVAVVVTVSTPHRAEAFAAAEFCIDTLKHTIPIWKRETWAGGSDWSQCAHQVGDPGPAAWPHAAPQRSHVGPYP